jgi:class 3 adenylate cyclase/tetratricopeptide (TPR) repeat protein
VIRFTLDWQPRIRRQVRLGPKVERGATAPESARSGRALFRREGEYWTVEHGDSALRLRDSKGLGYLATLFASPDVEIAAADLVAGGARGATTAQEGLTVTADVGDAGELLDEAAKTSYRERIEELRAELEEAESWNDPERVAAAREELDFLSHELASAVGLGGRDRKAASASERARVNVTRAIRSALKRIGENDAELGRRLEAAVKTGTFCCYSPTPELEVLVGSEAQPPPARPPTDRAPRTLLFTDIVGSTEHVARLGDEGWRDVLARHDELIRGLVAEHDGQVVGKAGDGFFVSFDAPRPALACARRASAGVVTLGLRLRAGLHTGECEPHEGTLVGMAVHVAARISALAAPGQVLASRTVRDLVAGSDLELVDRGDHDLRGIPGEWRLFALSAPGLEVEGPPPGEVEVPDAAPAPVDVHEPPASLFGRERELAELRRALEDAADSRGSLFLISGEPGVGKTRLADALSQAAREQGALVLWGRCWEAGGAPAYWPWLQVLRGYVRDGRAAEVAQQIGPGADALAQLVPELGIAPGVAGQPAESDDARFVLFNAVTGFLREASRRAPLVVVLDDLQAADDPSLLLLDFLARELRDASILAIGTYRPLELHASDVIGRLTRDGRVIPLSGLSEQDVRRFVAERSGVDSDELARAVHNATEGNPFFVEELVRLLVAEGSLERPGALVSVTLPVPDSVRGAIGRHLAPLSADTVKVLELASVVGKEFTFAALERASRLPPERLLDVLDRAISNGLVEEVATVVGRYRFVHALVREVLYDRIRAGERVELHRRAAAALESIYADDPEPHMAELAHHFLMAAPGGDLERAIDYTTQAGDRAMALLAFEEAVRHYRHALEAIERRDPADPAARRDLLLDLGAALRKAGDPLAAKEAFHDAADLSRRLGDPEKQAQATLGFAEPYWTTGVVDQSVIAMLEDALDALGEEDTRLRAALLARLSTELYYATPRSRADELSAQAVEITRRLGDQGALASVLDARLAATWAPDNLEERLKLSEQVVDLAERAGDKETALRVRAFHVSCQLEAADVARSDEALQAARQRAEYLRQPRYLWHVTGVRTLRALMSGRLADGERLMEEALEFGRHADERIARHIYAIQLTTLRYTQGRLEEIEPTMRSFVDQYPHLHGWRSTLALLYAELDQPAKARAEFEAVGAGGWAQVPRDSAWLLTICRAADTCSKLGDPEAAAELYELLLPFAERNVVLGRVASIAIGSASRHLGQLAATLERFDEAVDHFEAALRINRNMGARPWLGLSECDYAEMLRARDDGERADELVTRALQLSDEFGLGIVERHAGAR